MLIKRTSMGINASDIHQHHILIPTSSPPPPPHDRTHLATDLPSSTADLEQQQQRTHHRIDSMASLFHIKFVSEQGIRNLSKYAYRGVDNSITIRLFLGAIWERVILWVPRSIAPNVITLAGGIFVLLAYLLCAYYSPSLTEPMPKWSLVAAAVFLWSYQLMDNLDGKQAKRTKNGSALGELFDHGVDSIVMGLIGAIVSTVMRGPVPLSCVGVLLSMCPFYLSHWEEYHAGILVMGAFNGPTELQHVVCLVLLFTAWAGSDIWLRPLPFMPQFSYNHGVFVAIGVFSILGTLSSIVNVLRHTIKGTSELKSTPVEGMAQPLPFALFSGLSLVWVYSTQETVIAHPHLHFAILTLVFAYLTQRLLVQRICKEPFRAAYKVQLPLALSALNGVLFAAGMPSLAPLTVMWALLVVAFCQEAVFVVSIINQLCEALNIRPFVPKKVAA
eukprot:m51a1_g2335 hypothetical protein (445) ;mRNA; r:534857-538887